MKVLAYAIALIAILKSAEAAKCKKKCKSPWKLDKKKCKCKCDDKKLKCPDDFKKNKDKCKCECGLSSSDCDGNWELDKDDCICVCDQFDFFKIAECLQKGENFIINPFDCECSCMMTPDEALDKGENYIIDEEICEIVCGLTEEDALKKGKNYIVNEEKCELECGLNPEAPEGNTFNEETCEYECKTCVLEGMTAVQADFIQKDAPDCACAPAEGISKCNKMFDHYWEFDDAGLPCKVPGSGATALGAMSLAIATSLLF